MRKMTKQPERVSESLARLRATLEANAPSQAEIEAYEAEQRAWEAKERHMSETPSQAYKREIQEQVRAAGDPDSRVLVAAQISAGFLGVAYGVEPDPGVDLIVALVRKYDGRAVKMCVLEMLDKKTKKLEEPWSYLAGLVEKRAQLLNGG